MGYSILRKRQKDSSLRFDLGLIITSSYQQLKRNWPNQFFGSTIARW